MSPPHCHIGFVGRRRRSAKKATRAGRPAGTVGGRALDSRARVCVVPGRCRQNPEDRAAIVAFSGIITDRRDNVPTAAQRNRSI